MKVGTIVRGTKIMINNPYSGGRKRPPAIPRMVELRGCYLRRWSQLRLTGLNFNAIYFILTVITIKNTSEVFQSNDQIVIVFTTKLH